jgi:hypothetical protein
VAGNPWPFAESPDVGVYTTRQLLREGAPLGLISHDLDGDWQFLHHIEFADDEEVVERSVDDLVIVHLSHIVASFPQVAEYADLPVGWIAWPDDGGSGWIRQERPAEWGGREEPDEERAQA